MTKIIKEKLGGKTRRGRINLKLQNFLPLLIFCLAGCSPKTKTTKSISSNQLKPRTIVTTDGEIDDVNSFIRMLLYANEFRLEGLVISSSMWHYKGDGKGTLFTSEMEMTKKRYGAVTNLRWPGTTWMYPLIDAYERVYPQLCKNAKAYPTAKYLRSIVKVGNIDFEGEMDKDTEGSDFIKTNLLNGNTEPVYLQVWGGTNTIARALKSIEDEFGKTKKWKEIYDRVCHKAIIYAVMDQDATYKKYIAPRWPDIKVFYNSYQFWCFGYPWKKYVPESQQYLLKGDFLRNNIINNHGPLLKQYYSYGDGKHQEGDNENIHGNLAKINERKGSNFEINDFISEGDSPAYLHLIDIGLDNLKHPEWGGWGGRLVQSKQQPNRWEDGELAADFNPFTNKMDTSYPQVRWLEAIQNDFAARADWCIKDYKDANHSPSVKLKTAGKITARPGETVILSGEATDPDNNDLIYCWWQYKEVGTYKKSVFIVNPNQTEASFIMPSGINKGETIHLIFEVRDNGIPQLTRYKRLIVTAE